MVRLKDSNQPVDLTTLAAHLQSHELLEAVGGAVALADDGRDVADVLLGARRSVLPFPAVVVADRAGVVRHADVRPDGAAYPEPAQILAALR